MKIFSLLQKAGLNAFFLLLILMVALAWWFPYYGTKESPVPLGIIANAGVSLIFFFYGLRLSFSKLVAGLSNWKLHLLIQATTFILFPALIIILHNVFFNPAFELWWLGVFYLAALPSTVSSSVVMISISGGNLSAGVFNASISSILGILITPLWMQYFLKQSEVAAADLSTVVVTLCLQVLAPLVLGLLLHHKLGKHVERYRIQLRQLDQAIILIIVYRAFAESFSGNMFESFTFGEILLLSALMLVLFAAMAAAMLLLAGAMKFSIEDRITLLFCGSKKSLVQGAVMGQVLFTNPATFGIILLPLMLYHALQLLAGSVIAQRFSARN